MSVPARICAVVPIKDTTQAKQRLAGVLSASQRRQLALTMAEDVLAALAAVALLDAIVVVSGDEQAAALARRYGARITADGRRAGHTGAVAAAANQLATEGCSMLTVPGDIPLLAPGDIERLLAAHAGTPAFTITPSRDGYGSNAVLCSPADCVPLRFGDHSFPPHLLAARARGIDPIIVRLPRIALDVDQPGDLALIRRSETRTLTRALLERWCLRDAHLVAQLSSASA